MSDRYDRDRIRDEHIRSEQRREERIRTEASQKTRREIEDGFRRLDAAGRDVERMRADNSVHLAKQNIVRCEAEIERLLAKLKTLPAEPDFTPFLLFPGSNADIRRKAEVWDESFKNIRLSAETDVWTIVQKIKTIRDEVDKYRFPSLSPGGISFLKVRLSDAVISLLSELGSKLLWLDQYHLELDAAKQKRRPRLR